MEWTDVVKFVLFFMSVVAHEVAHGWAALMLGDHTARLKGRLTFNPVSHVDPVMSIIVPLFVYFFSGRTIMFGGAKPVPINVLAFKRPDRDMMLTALAGPLTNVLAALFFSLVLAVYTAAAGAGHDFGRDAAVGVFRFMVGVNFFLALFNLVPIPPLDGSRVLRYLMPWDIRRGMDRVEQSGMGMFFVVMFVFFLGTPVFRLFDAFIGWYLGLILPATGGW